MSEFAATIWMSGLAQAASAPQAAGQIRPSSREFAPIAALDGIALLSLQKGEAQKAIAEYYGRAPLFNLGAEVGDFLDTMSIIDLLDVVVTPDVVLKKKRLFESTAPTKAERKKESA